jgi:diaminopimelate epimerase
MELNFYKYQGAGNDFILVDDREQRFALDQDAIAKVCDRRFGIGADGLILLQNDADYDFRMVYFNADGGEGSMCGNGGRCVVRFAHDLGVIEDSTRFIAFDGEHKATVYPTVIELGMSDVDTITEGSDYYFLNTGSPHYVALVPAVDEVNVVERGREVRYGQTFAPQGGTNVNFVEILGENQLKVRTYERGVEDETLACGTGVTAAVLVSARLNGWKGPVDVLVPGGKLSVAFVQDEREHRFTEIQLIGPAEFVFRGTL